MKQSRLMAIVLLLLPLPSSIAAGPFHSLREGRSQRLRRANQTEAPAPQAGALIRTAGAGWKAAPGSPQQNQFVEAGGVIAGGGGHYLNLHPGIQTGPRDKLPTPTPGTTASGRNGITPNETINISVSGDSDGPPFPGGASGKNPSGSNK